MKNVLILFSAEFPYGNGETFLETEIVYLATAFDEVRIISRSKTVTTQRAVPENVKVFRISDELSAAARVAAVARGFTPANIRELNVIRKQYKLRVTSGMVKTFLISRQKARHIRYELRKHLQEISREDNVVAYSYWCDDAAIALAMEKRQNNTLKAVCRIHRWDVYFEESAVHYLPFRQFIAQHLDKIYSISAHGIDYAERVWKIDRKHFALSRLGIRSYNGPVTPDETRFKIVSCSNLIPVKRVTLLASALKELSDQEVEWTHFGDGPQLEALKKETDALPENIRVDFKGRIPNRQIYEAYAALKPDLFINVSASEGVPVSIMEAMSFGIPVIATAVGGTPEIVNNENGTLLAEDPTAQEVADVIRNFMALSQAEQEEKRRAAYATWKEEYNAEKNYTEFVTEIMKLN